MGAPEGVTVMVWRDQMALAAAEQGFDVIAAPQRYTYFDYSQYEHGQPLSIAGPLTLEQTTGLAGEMRLEGGQELLIGGQFQLWTEYVRGWERAEYQLQVARQQHRPTTLGRGRRRRGLARRPRPSPPAPHRHAAQLGAAPRRPTERPPMRAITNPGPELTAAIGRWVERIEAELGPVAAERFSAMMLDTWSTTMTPGSVGCS